jgi:hypothetical protein
MRSLLRKIDGDVDDRAYGYVNHLRKPYELCFNPLENTISNIVHFYARRQLIRYVYAAGHTNP